MTREYCDRCGKEIKCDDICIDVDARQRYGEPMKKTLCMDCGLQLEQFFITEYSLRGERREKAMKQFFITEYSLRGERREKAMKEVLKNFT